MTREPVVAGMFYPESPDEIRKQIKISFHSDYGPGSLPGASTEEIILGAISPHAGYVYSGPAAAHTYKAIAESKKPDTFIILAPNHTGLGRTSLILDDYKTPLGTVKVNKTLGKEILKNCKNLVEDEGSHLQEHSLEVQLPFLQYIYKNDFQIVPIIISGPVHIEDIAAGVKKTIESQEEHITIIASSDFTHYGPNYQYNIFADNVKENITKLDMKAIKHIEHLDYKGFLNFCQENQATICGSFPIAVMLMALEGKAQRGELLKYYKSSDIMSDPENSVSYASIIIK